MPENITRLTKRNLAAEKARRLIFRQQITRIIEARYSFSSLAVGRGRVYETIAEDLNEIGICVPINEEFRRRVTRVMRSLGVRAVCTHKVRLFRGIHDEEAYAKHLQHEADKAERRAARPPNQNLFTKKITTTD